MMISNKDILIIGSHLDDIEIGMGETLRRLLKPDLNNTIKIIVMSSGLYKLNSTKERVGAFEACLQHLGIPIKNTRVFSELIDTQFQDSVFDLKRYLEVNTKELFPDGPEVIFSQDIDLHTDHRITNELVDIIARPDTSVQMYFKYCIPGSSAFHELQYQTAGGVLFNNFKDFAFKKKLLNEYNTAGIFPAENGIRSTKGIKQTNKFWGSISGNKSGNKYAEKFRIGFLNASF